MSRIVVKNIPKDVTEDRVRTIFSDVGTVTDVQLKRNQKGEFRGFGFVGFKSELEAAAALKRFNNSFIRTSKIKIEICSNLGDPNKPRAWSKHSKDSTAFKEREKAELAKAALKKAAEEKAAVKKTGANLSKKNKQKFSDIAPAEEAEKETEKEASSLLPDIAAKIKNKTVVTMLEKYKDDPLFAEFFDLHTKKSKEILWTNDIIAEMPVIVSSETQNKNKKNIKPKDKLVYDDDDDSEESGISAGEEVSDLDPDEPKKSSKKLSKKRASTEQMSDMDYLKSKLAAATNSADSGDESGSLSAGNEEAEEQEAPRSKKDRTKTPKTKKNKLKTDEEYAKENALTLKVVGLPVNCKRSVVRSFFNPVKLVAARFPRSRPGQIFVQFKNEKDMKAALFKHNGFYEGRRVSLTKLPLKRKEVSAEATAPVAEKWEQKTLELEKTAEQIAESGSLFLRNLSYTTTEEDIEQLFSKFGALSEVRLPVDRYTRKPLGFAVVNFLITEDATRAFSELDGTIFQGRNLHILPSKEKPAKAVTANQGSSFKTGKAAEEKAKSASSHNWNALFVGANAVADAVAKRYNTDKQTLFDAENPESMAVRMALGETQVVNEIREFLVENGIELDAFGKPGAERSKVVILVKNLSANVSIEKVRDAFAKHGAVGRVIMPPAGITAVVEFLDPNEARIAFKTLAYSKFEGLPLYLEWAPVNVFRDPASNLDPSKSGKQEEESELEGVTQKDDDESSTVKTKTKKKKRVREGEQEATVEVAAAAAAASPVSDDEQPAAKADPNAVLYVKNLNFDTRDDALRKHFERVGPVESVTVTLKKDLKNPGNMLSCGFGFVHFMKKEDAMKALKNLQHSMLDDHSLELKVSNRTTTTSFESRKSKSAKETVQSSAKIMVRNIPFEAKKQELEKLFGTFGELKFVRMPKKANSSDGHRGFGFVEFVTKEDAKRAFKALSQSTHFYGRHLVLEWANPDDTVDAMRENTAKHYFEGAPAPKRLRKSVIVDNLMGIYGDEKMPSI